MAYPSNILTSDAVTSYRTYINALLGSRGKFSQATAGTMNSATYGALSNGPDAVANVVLPADGLIFIAYKALWKGADPVVAFTRAAIFIGATQLKNGVADAAPAVQEVIGGWDSSTNYSHLYTTALGLATTSSATVDSTDVTTGQTVAIGSGGPVCAVFAAAGTYTVSVQFKVDGGGGTATVKDRHLWVWGQQF